MSAIIGHVNPILYASAALSFEAASAVLGVLLILGALLSGLARRSMLSLAVVFVLAGFLLGHGGLEVVDLQASSGFVEDLAAVALIVILFRDGLEVDAQMLQSSWHLPLRKLVIGMPVTALLVAVLARLLVGLGWTEALLLGALLSPTDPVLSSGVVTDPRVPRLVRNSLNLESGLNDGLALPAVLAFAAALEAGSSDFVWWRYVLQDLGLGLAFGLVCGFAGSWLMPRASGPGDGGGIPGYQRALYGLGLAFATYGITVLPPHGNGFIAVFVAAIVVGIRRPDLRELFARHTRVLVELVKLGVFAVFGSLLTLNGLFEDGAAALAFVVLTFVLARPAAIWLALSGSRIGRPAKLFMAWFGPKGVATITYSLLILAHGVREGQRIFDLAALAVFVSILLHGSSELPGIAWLARRTAAEEPAS